MFMDFLYKKIINLNTRTYNTSLKTLTLLQKNCIMKKTLFLQLLCMFGILLINPLVSISQDSIIKNEFPFKDPSNNIHCQITRSDNNLNIKLKTADKTSIMKNATHGICFLF